mmetsp:Transcript_94899/g.277478  ORF Transcript_94899/g.277478 Transcript_94899/m.277478 type:complete len:89 (+) Transcript_94899:1634-1900(+)
MEKLHHFVYHSAREASPWMHDEAGESEAAAKIPWQSRICHGDAARPKLRQQAPGLEKTSRHVACNQLYGSSQLSPPQGCQQSLNSSLE